MSKIVQRLSNKANGMIRTNLTTGMRQRNNIAKRNHFSGTGESDAKGSYSGAWALSVIGPYRPGANHWLSRWSWFFACDVQNTVDVIESHLAALCRYTGNEDGEQGKGKCALNPPILQVGRRLPEHVHHWNTWNWQKVLYGYCSDRSSWNLECKTIPVTEISREQEKRK